MTEYFSASNYFLLTLSMLLHYPIGRKFINAGFFTSCVVGLCFSGIIGGVLANFNAGLIVWYFYFFLLLNVILLVFDFIRKIKQKKINWVAAYTTHRKYFFFYICLIPIGIFLFVINDPSTVFLEFDVEKKMTFLNFNSHYSYYSSVSVEILNADYLGRLKLMNVYPHEWAQYHFFNSATQAAVQIFIDKPNLFTFFMAQTLIFIFVILAIGEEILLRSKNLSVSLAIFLGWLIIGFTLFSDCLTWNLTTSGMLSVFALILFLISLYYNQYKNTFFFLMILGISAIRLFPVVAMALAIFILCTGIYGLMRSKTITLAPVKEYLRSLTALEYAFILCCFAYIIVTLNTGALSGETKTDMKLIGPPFSNAGWQFSLITYRMIGFIYDFFFQLKDTYPFYSYGGFFAKINTDPLYKYLFVGVIAFLIFFMIKNVRFISGDVIYSSRVANLFLLFLVLLFIYPYVLSLYNVARVDLVRFNIIFIPYLLLTLIFCTYALGGINTNKTFIVLLLLLITYLFQHSGVIESVKMPISFVFFDLMVWGLVLLFLLNHADDPGLYIPLSLFLLILLMILPNSFYSTLRLPEDYHSKKQDITKLVSKDFKRESFVDSTNMMYYDAGDEVANDIYSSVLGARMKYNETYGKTDKILNYRFKPR